MKREFVIISLLACVLAGMLGCSKGGEINFPLKEGARWEYQVVVDRTAARAAVEFSPVFMVFEDLIR